MRTAAALICALALTVASAECFRVLQAASYRPQRGYFKVYFSAYAASLFAVQVVAVASELLWEFVCCYIDAAMFSALALAWSLVRRKSPLRLTKRIRRMFAVQAVVLSALCLFVNCGWWVWLLPVITVASWGICLPTDIAVNRYYIGKARAKLAESGATVIAVTGSYGKTSVKDMLAVLLNDCVSPRGSCNTPLGIAAYINGTDLSGARYLVLEFGARRKKDVAELCRLYRPRYGIVTGVCAQHLSTFGSIDNVIAAKRELPENLPPDGFCILNQRDGIVAGFANAGVCAKYMSEEGIVVKAVSVDFGGTLLEVEYDGERRRITLPQISDYIADTFAVCLQTTLRLGQEFNVTLDNAANIQPTPHRLQLMKGAGFHILDDSYNGSATGVASCCRTLAKFDCVKVVITQGLTECGKARREMNVECGWLLGCACDAAVVLGKNKKYLAEGLMLTDCRISFANSIDQAVRIAAPLAQGGILLFQNDLPDVANL